jgi:hypothetical protein
MKDPHIHVEKMPMPGFGHAAMRELIVTATGLAPDMPKTVGTGCGKRRPLAMTSTIPERVTCLACRDYARSEHLNSADSIATLLSYDDDMMNEAIAAARTTREALAAQARHDRATAARYGT